MKKISLLLAVSLFFAIGCTTKISKVDNTAGRATLYEDPSTAGGVQGIGIESQDIIAMTDQMARDMLTIPELMNRKEPPRVILDSKYFVNESTNRINKNIITRKLKTQLSRATRGKIIFVGREHSAMVEGERELKRTGTVDVATTGMAKKTFGADYRLAGSITSQEGVRQTGDTSRYTVIFFTLVDLETSAEVWNNEYQFKKTARDDIIYR